MDAVVYLDDDGQHYVSLRVAGHEVEVAGPFDDEIDAVQMAERNVYGNGRVSVTGYQHPIVEQEAA